MRTGTRRIKARDGAAVIIVLGFAVAVFLPIDMAAASPLSRSVLNFIHFPAFFIVAWAICRVARLSRENAARNAAIMLGAGFGGAVAIECLQLLVGRDFDLVDIGVGLLGVSSFLMAEAGGDATRGRRFRWFSFGAALIPAILAVAPIAVEGAGEAARWFNFPVLGKFNSRLELKYWVPQGGSRSVRTAVSLADAPPPREGRALRVSTGKGSWSGVSYLAGRQNWEGFEYLQFRVFSGDETFQLNMRIDDCNESAPKFGFRFDGNVTVSAGWNHVSLRLDEIARRPEHRQLSLGCVRRLAFFTGASEPAREFHLAGIRLAGKPVRVNQ